MMYKTIEGIANQVAEMAVQNAAYSAGRWIWHISDFTEEDRDDLQRFAVRVAEILQSADGRTLEDVLTDIKATCGDSFHLGFTAQNEIVQTCKHCGVIIRTTTIQAKEA